MVALNLVSGNELFRDKLRKKLEDSGGVECRIDDPTGAKSPQGAGSTSQATLQQMQHHLTLAVNASVKIPGLNMSGKLQMSRQKKGLARQQNAASLHNSSSASTSGAYGSSASGSASNIKTESGAWGATGGIPATGKTGKKNVGRKRKTSNVPETITPVDISTYIGGPGLLSPTNSTSYKYPKNSSKSLVNTPGTPKKRKKNLKPDLNVAISDEDNFSKNNQMKNRNFTHIDFANLDDSNRKDIKRIDISN